MSCLEFRDFTPKKRLFGSVDRFAIFTLVVDRSGSTAGDNERDAQRR